MGEPRQGSPRAWHGPGTVAQEGRPFYRADVAAPTALVIANYSPILNSTLAHELSDACRANQVDQLKKLLLAGARTDVPNHLGQYPIHTAAGAKACGCLQLLIRQGADINAKFGREGHTAVHFAAKAGSVTALKILKAAGADMTLRDEHGNTPTHIAAREGHATCAAYLLALPEVDANCLNKHNMAPLHLAAEGDHFNTTVYLLKHFANVSIVGDEGTASEMAKAKAAAQTPALLTGLFPNNAHHLPDDILDSFQRQLARLQTGYSPTRHCSTLEAVEALHIPLQISMATSALARLKAGLDRALASLLRRLEAWRKEQASVKQVQVAAARVRGVLGTGIPEARRVLRKMEERPVPLTALTSAGRCVAEVVNELRELLQRMEAMKARYQAKDAALSKLHRCDRAKSEAQQACLDAPRADRPQLALARRHRESEFEAALAELSTFEVDCPDVATSIAEPLTPAAHEALKEHRLMKGNFSIPDNFDTLSREWINGVEVRKSQPSNKQGRAVWRGVTAVPAGDVERAVLVPHALRGHAGFVKVRCTFMYHRVLYKEEEWCKHTLASWLQTTPKVSARAVVTSCIAKAVQHLHSHYIVHGALNASSILIDSEGKPKITSQGAYRSRGVEAFDPAPDVAALSALMDMINHEPSTTSIALVELRGALTPALPSHHLPQKRVSCCGAGRPEDGICVLSYPGSSDATAQVASLPPAAIELVASKSSDSSCPEALPYPVARALWQWSEKGEWHAYPASESNAMEEEYQQLRALLLAADPAAQLPRFVALSDRREVKLSTTGFSETRTQASSGKQEFIVQRQCRLPIPLTWTQLDSQRCTVVVEHNTAEFTDVLTQLNASLPSATMTRLVRIQNQPLLLSYTAEKRRLLLSRRPVNERQLWHGTRKTPAIKVAASEEGIDHRVGKYGWYGKGAYFASEASYSDHGFAHILPNGDRQLILANVLCGQDCWYGTQQAPRLDRPPPGHDSVMSGPWCDRGCRPSLMHVVYNRAAVYPAYVVTYRAAARSSE